jgi:hypothetical protein
MTPPAFLKHVCNVIGLRTNEQMVWIYTRRHIAAMQNV